MTQNVTLTVTPLCYNPHNFFLMHEENNMTGERGGIRRMKKTTGEANRYFHLCVDSCENGVPEGRLFHPNLENEG